MMKSTNATTRPSVGRNPHGMRVRLRNVLLMAASATAALASVSGAARAEDGKTEDLVVTAERRETNLQNTPISVVALSSRTIENKGIEDIADLTLFTPNLAIQGGRFTGNNAPSFIIRGISGGGGATGERGVALYIDGIYVPRTSGSVFKVFDLERVEVLRGPQGTLFGRNSTGGAIRLITKQPSTKNFEGYLKGTFGNFERHDLIGMVNLPVGDNFAVRVQGGWLNEDGYVRRGTQLLGGSEDKIIRVQTRWDAASNFTATFGFLYSDSKSDGNPQDIAEFDMRPGIEGVIQGNYGDWLNDAFKKAGQAPLAAFNDPRLVLDDYTAPGMCFLDDFDPDWDEACALSNDTKYTQADAVLTWDFNDKTRLTSTSGWSKMKHSGFTDNQLIGFSNTPDNVRSEVFYQELQLNTKLFMDAVDLVVGGNYFHENSKARNKTITRRGTSVFPATANGNGDAGLFVTGDSIVGGKSDSFGVFGSGTWHITDRLNFTGGVRYAYDKKYLDQTTIANASFVPVAGTDRTRVTADHSWTDVDWRATVDYHFSEDVMAYTTVSKAYKAGAYSYTILQRVPGDQQSGDFITPIPPEKVMNYEFGFRTNFLDNRLRFNPTFFYMQWTNRQAPRQISCVSEGIQACPTGFRILLVNSGDVHTWGWELDGQFVATNQLSFDFSLGITEYSLKDIVANGGPNLFPAQASPSYTVGANYRLPIGSAGDLGFNVSYSYLGAQPTHPEEGTDSSYTLPAYGIVNGRVVWRAPNQKYSVAAFANNLLDEDYGTFASSAGGGFWDAGGPPNPANAAQFPLRRALGVTRGRPREVGVTLQYNF
jgi:iron complex outermembrane receptor protein